MAEVWAEAAVLEGGIAAIGAAAQNMKEIACVMMPLEVDSVVGL